MPQAAPSGLVCGFDADRLARLRAYMQRLVDVGALPGVSYSLVRRGEEVDAAVIGVADLASGAPMQRDTIVRIASMTKPVTAVAMMMLFEEGRWRLDDPVTRFLPEFEGQRVFAGRDADGALRTEPASRPPTMRELMSHTAGFGYGMAPDEPVERLYRENGVLRADSLQQMAERAADISLMYQPGTRWAYSIAVDVQGLVVERLSGMRFSDFLRSRIFDPLGMEDTGFFVSADKAGRVATLYGAGENGGVAAMTRFPGGGPPVPSVTEAPRLEMGGGGLVSTLKDYGRFCQMVLNGGALAGARLLAPSTVELMGVNVLAPGLRVDMNGVGVARYGPDMGFGLGFSVLGTPRRAGSLEGPGTMAWGGAFGTWFWIDRANDLFFIGLTQRMGVIPGEDVRADSRTLVYQALIESAPSR